MKLPMSLVLGRGDSCDDQPTNRKGDSMARQIYSPVRSVRVDDELWHRAQIRAAADGVTMSRVLLRFVQGYADGRVDLPRTELVFSDGS